jgi:hypothetical protein
MATRTLYHPTIPDVTETVDASRVQAWLASGWVLPPGEEEQGDGPGPGLAHGGHLDAPFVDLDADRDDQEPPFNNGGDLSSGLTWREFPSL